MIGALRKRHAEEGKGVSVQNAPKRKAKKSKRGRVNEGHSRAYELIKGAGGIPGKIAARSLSETRAKTAARMQKNRSCPSRGNVTDNRKGSGNVIPWPK